MTMRTVVLLYLLSNCCCTTSLWYASGFDLSQLQQRMTSASSTANSLLLLRAAVSFNDFDDASIGDATSEEGQELAQEFYDQLRRRQDEEQERRRQLERLEQALRISSMGIPRRPPSQQPRVRQDVLDFEKEFRKWTGQVAEDDDAVTTTSAGFFRGGGSSVYSYPTSSTMQSSSSSGAALDDDLSLMSHAERAMLSVLPYVLALAVVVSLAVGSGAFEADEVFWQDSSTFASNVATSSTSAAAAATTTTSMTASLASSSVETNNLQQHIMMDQVLLRKTSVLL